MPRPSRAIAQEIDDVEQWIATVSEYLDVLEIAATNAASDRNGRLQRVIQSKIDAQLRRLAELHRRRAELHQQLGGS